MRRFNMYAVKDEMTGKYMSPIFLEDNDTADQEAIRDFKSKINNIQLWKDNANDFSLFKVGGFDEEEGAYAVAIEKITSGRSVLNG